MAGSVEESSNSNTPLSKDYPLLEQVFAELSDWEDQLKDVNFEAIAEREAGNAEAIENDKTAVKPKRGGPSPC